MSGASDTTDPDEAPDLNLATAVLEQLVAVYEGSGLVPGASAPLAPGESARRQEIRFRTLVESIPAVFFLAFLDEELANAYVSPQIEKMLGFSQDEWLGNPVLWYRQIHPEDKTRWSEEAARLLCTGEPLDSTYRVLARDGRVVHFRCRVGIGRDTEGKPLFGHGVGVDITKLKETEEELRRGIRQLERANAELEQFAYTAAHDLRTPLRQIHSYIQLLETRIPMDDPQVGQWMSYILEGTRRLQVLVQDVGAYSGLRRREAVEPVDLGAVAREVAESLAVQASEVNGHIEVALDLPTIQGHRSHMTQLFQNLIENALKYRHPERSPRVQVAAVAHHDRWEVSVSDNGPGIPAEYREKVFMLFQRLVGQETHEGTGIGLATCKKVVELLGGRIWVEESSSGGARFRFTVPRSQG